MELNFFSFLFFSFFFFFFFFSIANVCNEFTIHQVLDEYCECQYVLKSAEELIFFQLISLLSRAPIQVVLEIID